MAKQTRKNNRTDRGPRLMFVLFVFIFIYLGSFVIKYMTKEKVDIHEVTTGSINANNTYTGIAIRQEEIFYSEYAGNINYFIREGERAAVGSVVYTVDETGKVASMIESLNSGDNYMSDSNKAIIRNALSSYKTSSSNDRFYDIYDLKDKLDLVISDSVNENIVKNLDDMIKDTASENLFRYSKATKSGIVVYNVDGFENMTVEQLNENSFNRDSYIKTNLRAENIVVAESPVYKMITDEMWQIAIPLTNEQIEAQDLAQKKNVKIRFVKDNITTYANFAIVPTGGGTYGVLSLNKFMIQYASERFIDVEIVTSSSFGLKIPVTAIVEKEFFTIPKKFGTTGGNQSRIGFLREHQDESGKIVTEYCDVDIYASDDEFYYVDKTDFTYGDSIIMPDSQEVYTLTTVGMLQGAYTVNKGYAVFRRIEIIEQNQEYAIVKTGLSYGLSAYDHIVLDGTKVEENQIIY